MVLRTTKSAYVLFLLSLFIIFNISLLSYNTSNSTTGINLLSLLKTRQLKAQPDSSSTMKLVQVLRRASMSDRSVILTIVDQAWARPGSVLDLFLESFRIGLGTEPLLSHLVIITLDTKAFLYCISIHPHCFYLTNPAPKYATKKPLLIPDRLKYKLFRQVIQLGYSFFFTDADVMWFRNPALHIQSMKELAISCNFYSGDSPSISNNVDGEFFYVKSNELSLEYLKYRYMTGFLYPNSEIQPLCHTDERDNVFEFIDFRIAYLDEAHFGGFCQERKNMSEIVTMHADCCDSIESKVHDLKLLLEDWRNFTALSTERNSLGGSPFTWRAPNKCKG